MRYLPEPTNGHALDPMAQGRPSQTIGVLLVNLGTPDEPTAGSIRRYLAEFLSDVRVIEIPPAVWQVILRLFVLPRRPGTLVSRYKGIWLDQGSPLLVWSQAMADGVRRRLGAADVPARVALGMRYGNPSIAQAMAQLRAAGCERILTVPLYPQYAASTTATAVDKVASYAARLRNQPELRFVKRYYDDGGYIQALAGRIKRYWAENGKPQRLLLSFHGLPQRCVLQGDPYYQDCMQTAALLREALGEDGALVHVSFQSRFGAAKWLEPYTEPTLKEWAGQGITHVDVMCPGFLADCLETLEEIQVECRDAYLAAGGRQFRYLPCLNDDPAWLDALTAIVRRHVKGWID